ncbi:two-component system response regulator YesN [Paenibacillus rhizosphaerae]|uniref:Two-component system response regulator YesN n=1 Tax=Paenibacillus rhizosphaerae TaxID=297318 RepID=A0A839TVB2_9BACL|nr:response regulator [Paenibacillus rhizosphaerae]MBB3128627.1 two-component system response regulator YesN [Paenibacillus rhizosphaerae]
MFTIMIVDDEKMIKRSLRAMIERAGEPYSVTGEATNGRNALELIHRHPPHLLITDICMPEMDGLELISEVRQQYPLTEIIVISGYGEFKFAQQALRYNVTDYLLKPVDPDEFVLTLQRIHERHRRDFQRLMGRSEQTWFFLEDTERIILMIWTLQETGLRREIDGFREKVETAGMDIVLAKEIYMNQLVYISQKLSELGGLTYKISYTEQDPHPSLEKLHEKFLVTCMGMYNNVVQLRNHAQSLQIRKAIRYVDSNFQDCNLSLTSAAKRASMSVTYFSRMFKEETGLSFMKYVTRLRMEMARELLASSDCMVGDVAKWIGYSDYHHFAKAFKKNTGITPTEYKKIQTLNL